MIVNKKFSVFVYALIIMAVFASTTYSLLSGMAYASNENTDTIKCQSEEGTTMGGVFHFAGNCNGENGGSVTGGAINADSKACKGHVTQGPYDNTHFRGGCINK